MADFYFHFIFTNDTMARMQWNVLHSHYSPLCNIEIDDVLVLRFYFSFTWNLFKVVCHRRQQLPFLSSPIQCAYSPYLMSSTFKYFAFFSPAVHGCWTSTLPPFTNLFHVLSILLKACFDYYDLLLLMFKLLLLLVFISYPCVWIIQNRSYTQIWTEKMLLLNFFSVYPKSCSVDCQLSQTFRLQALCEHTHIHAHTIHPYLPKSNIK